MDLLTIGCFHSISKIIPCHAILDTIMCAYIGFLSVLYFT